MSRSSSQDANILDDVCVAQEVVGHECIVQLLRQLSPEDDGVHSSVWSPLLIGSRAMDAQCPPEDVRYRQQDWDFIATTSSMLAFFQSPAQINRYDCRLTTYMHRTPPVEKRGDNHMADVHDGASDVTAHCIRRKLTFELVTPASHTAVQCDVELVSAKLDTVITGNSMLAWLHQDINHAQRNRTFGTLSVRRYQKEWEALWKMLKFDVAPVWMLHALKESHIFWPIEFTKHISDLHFLRARAPITDKFEVEIKSDLVIRRMQEHELLHGVPGARINLDQSNEDFLERGDILSLRRYIEHDKIHEMVMYGQRPIYELLKKDPKKAMVDRELFEKAPMELQLCCVREEAMVIALERYILPGRLMIGHQQLAFTNALERICTTLTKGFFRQFAVDHYPQLEKLDRDLKPIWETLQGVVAAKQAEWENKRAVTCGLEIAMTYFLHDSHDIQHRVGMLLQDRTRSVYVPPCTHSVKTLKKCPSTTSPNVITRDNETTRTMVVWERPLWAKTSSQLQHAFASDLPPTITNPFQTLTKPWKKPVWLLMHPTDSTKYLGISWQTSKNYVDHNDSCAGSSEEKTRGAMFILLSHHANARNVTVFDLNLSESSGHSGGSQYVSCDVVKITDLLEELQWPAELCNMGAFLRLALAVLNPELKDISDDFLLRHLHQKYLYQWWCHCPITGSKKNNGHYHRECQNRLLFQTYQRQWMLHQHVWFHYYRANWFAGCPANRESTQGTRHAVKNEADANNSENTMFAELKYRSWRDFTKKD